MKKFFMGVFGTLLFVGVCLARAQVNNKVNPKITKTTAPAPAKPTYQTIYNFSRDLNTIGKWIKLYSGLGYHIEMYVAQPVATGFHEVDKGDIFVVMTNRPCHSIDGK